MINNGTPEGAVTYTGSADVIGPLGIKSSGGPVSVTQTAGTATYIAVETAASGTVDINTVGSSVGSLFARNISSAGSSDVTIRTGDVTDANLNGFGIYVQLGNGGRVTGRNVSVTTDGNVAGIRMSVMATGSIDLTTNAGVTNGINLEAGNLASSGAVRVNLNQDVAGDVSVSNAGSGGLTLQAHNIAGDLAASSGTGVLTVHAGNIAGSFGAASGGANNSVVVDGSVNTGTVTASRYSGSVAGVSLTGGGTNNATFNGAISGTFDASAAGGAAETMSVVTGLSATLGSSSGNGSASLDVNGPVTVTGIARSIDAANVTGASLRADFRGLVPADFNLHGAVTATSIGGTAASTVVGISASQSGLATLRLTADGAVTATASAAGSSSTGISVGATEFPGFLANPNTYIIRANGDVTATSDGAATGISVTRGIGNSVAAGSGGADLVSKGTVTATSTSAAAIGVRGVFANDATNAATLSLRTEGNVIANGTAAGSYGIFAQRGGTGDLRIDVLAGVQSTGTGIGATRTTAGNIFITTGSNAAISGVTGVVDLGRHHHAGQSRQHHRHRRHRGAVRRHQRCAADGVGQHGERQRRRQRHQHSAARRHHGRELRSIKTLRLLEHCIVGRLELEFFRHFELRRHRQCRRLPDAEHRHVQCQRHRRRQRHAGGQRQLRQPHRQRHAGARQLAGHHHDRKPDHDDGGYLSGAGHRHDQRQDDRHRNCQYRRPGRRRSAGAAAEADHLHHRDAGTLNGTFASASVAGTSNFARNPILSYVGNDVLLTLDPGLLSPVLPGNANANQIKVAGAIDNALLAGNNLSNAFSAIFNYSGNNLLNGLTQLSGETATGSQQTTFNAMNQFMGMMTDPFTPGRSDNGTPQTGAVPYAEENALAYASNGNSSREREAYAAMYRKAPSMADTLAQRWSVWGAAYGGSQATDGNIVTGSNNTTSRVFGVAAGADYRFSPNTIAGFALAGGGTSFSVAGGGSGRSDLFQTGAFIKHKIGAAYISGALAYGWQDVTTDRTVTIAGIDRLRAQFNANAFSGRAEGGYRFVSPWIGGIGITPYAAAQFTTFDLPAYAEQVVSGANTFALAYGSRSVTATRSELGLRADKSFAMTNAVLTLRGRAAWAHDFNPDRAVGRDLPDAARR